MNITKFSRAQCGGVKATINAALKSCTVLLSRLICRALDRCFSVNTLSASLFASRSSRVCCLAARSRCSFSWICVQPCVRQRCCPQNSTWWRCSGTVSSLWALMELSMAALLPSSSHHCWACFASCSAAAFAILCSWLTDCSRWATVRSFMMLSLCFWASLDRKKNNLRVK